MSTSNFTAEYGRAGGGVVNVSTKSGTNQFHGSLYEFNRVSALAANTYQNDANGVAKPGFTRNQFGYAIGGPIVKNKLFFFSSTEWTRVRSEPPIRQSILDPAFLTQPGVSPNTQRSSTPMAASCVPGIQVLSSVELAGNKLNQWILSGAAALQRSVWPIPSPTRFNRRFRRWRSAEHLLDGRSAWTATFPTRRRSTAAMRCIAKTTSPGSSTAVPYVGYDTGQTHFNQSVTHQPDARVHPQLVNSVKFPYNRLTTAAAARYKSGGADVVHLELRACRPCPAPPGSLVFPGYCGNHPGQRHSVRRSAERVSDL